MAEEGRRWNAHQPVGSARPFQIHQQLVHDDAERDGHQRLVAVAGAHGWQAQQKAEDRRDDGGHHEADPEAHAEMDRQQCRGIGTDAVGRARGEVGNVGAAELKVQRQRQHRVETRDDHQVHGVAVTVEHPWEHQREHDAQADRQRLALAERGHDAVFQHRALLHGDERDRKTGQQHQHGDPALSQQKVAQQHRAAHAHAEHNGGGAHAIRCRHRCRCCRACLHHTFSIF